MQAEQKWSILFQEAHVENKEFKADPVSEQKTYHSDGRFIGLFPRKIVSIS